VAWADLNGLFQIESRQAFPIYAARHDSCEGVTPAPLPDAGRFSEEDDAEGGPVSGRVTDTAIEPPCARHDLLR